MCNLNKSLSCAAQFGLCLCALVLWGNLSKSAQVTLAQLVVFASCLTGPLNVHQRRAGGNDIGLFWAFYHEQ